eukprot:1393273-Amorphochlora_amoeboformis.AAC.2
MVPQGAPSWNAAIPTFSRNLPMFSGLFANLLDCHAIVTSVSQLVSHTSHPNYSSGVAAGQNAWPHRARTRS